MKNAKFLAVVALACAMLVGCSSSKPADNTTTTAAPTEGAAATEGNGTLYVASDTDLSTMDHHIATDGTSFISHTVCISGLTKLDDGNSPLPELAESWDISEDGLTYTFHLADAKWSNGTPVTANDFVFAWHRLIDPDTASEYSFILDTIHVVNAAEVNAGELPVEELGVKAIDDKTLEVQLSLPCDFLLGLMAFPSFFPLNEEFFNSVGDQYATTPDNMIYNGPYVMTNWTSGSGWSFEKNPDYFRADEDTDIVDAIEFKFVQDTQSAMLEYQSGNLDVVKLTGEQVDAYSMEEGFNNRLQGYLWYLSIDFTVEKFNNDNLRKALSLSVDRETIAKNVLKDGSIPAGGIIPEALASSPSGVDFREEKGTITVYDPEAAAEYYAKAVEELGGDQTIELLFEDTEASKAFAEYIQNNWETNLPGLTVTLNQKPKKTRLEMMNNQEYEVALTRWGPDYADPQTYMDLFVSTNTDNNPGRFNSAAYDEAVLEATKGDSATDSQARWDLLKKAEDVLVTDDIGVIPVYQNGGAMMITPTVKNLNFHSAAVDDYRHVTKGK